MKVAMMITKILKGDGTAPIEEEKKATLTSISFTAVTSLTKRSQNFHGKGSPLSIYLTSKRSLLSIYCQKRRERTLSLE